MLVQVPAMYKNQVIIFHTMEVHIFSAKVVLGVESNNKWTCACYMALKAWLEH